jgi:hypothetical protein
VFVPEHYFTYKSLAGVRETFGKAYPGKEVPFKTPIHRLESELLEAGSVCGRCQIVLTVRRASRRPSPCAQLLYCSLVTVHETIYRQTGFGEDFPKKELGGSETQY